MDCTHKCTEQKRYCETNMVITDIASFRKSSAFQYIFKLLTEANIMYYLTCVSCFVHNTCISAILSWICSSCSGSAWDLEKTGKIQKKRSVINIFIWIKPFPLLASLLRQHIYKYFYNVTQIFIGGSLRVASVVTFAVFASKILGVSTPSGTHLWAKFGWF